MLNADYKKRQHIFIHWTYFPFIQMYEWIFIIPQHRKLEKQIGTIQQETYYLAFCYSLEHVSIHLFTIVGNFCRETQKNGKNAHLAKRKKGSKYLTHPFFTDLWFNMGNLSRLFA